MSALDWTAIEDAIFDWVQPASGLGTDNVVWGAQSDDAPPAPYVELIATIGEIGQGWVDDEHNPLVLADDDVEAVSGDQLTLTGHAYQTGDGPVQLSTTGALPAPLAAATDYWIIVDDADTIRLAPAFTYAMATPPVPVTLTDAGSGVHTIGDTDETVRAGEEIIRKVRGSRRFELTITVIGGTPTESGAPFAIANAIFSKGRLPSVREGLRAAGLAIATFTPVQRIGLQQAVYFEPRARFQMIGFAADEVTELVGRIDTAEIEITVTTPGGSVSETFYTPEGDPYPP